LKGNIFSGRRMDHLHCKLIGLADSLSACKGIHRKIGTAIEVQVEPGCVGA